MAVEIILDAGHGGFDNGATYEGIKEKDQALFRLVRELKYKSNYKFIDSSSFEVI